MIDLTKKEITKKGYHKSCCSILTTISQMSEISTSNVVSVTVKVIEANYTAICASSILTLQLIIGAYKHTYNANKIVVKCVISLIGHFTYSDAEWICTLYRLNGVYLCGKMLLS